MQMKTTDCIRRSCRSPAGSWLPDMDLNHVKQIQSLLCYRYTIGQTSASKVKAATGESRLLKRFVTALAPAYGVRRQSGAGTPLWLKATRKEIAQLLRSQSGVVAAL